jgi:DNA-directed RNA polymerase subunit RPC12/RpoP
VTTIRNSPVSLFARGIGSVSYLCPACGSIHGPANLDWRRARIVCTSRKCRHVWRVGFVLAPPEGPLGGMRPPHNAWTSVLANPGTLRGLSTNRVIENIEQDGDVEPAIGRFTGSLEYVCPNTACGRRHREKVTEQGTTVCPNCGQLWVVGVIMWSTPQGCRFGGPYDWVMPASLDGAGRPIL